MNADGTIQLVPYGEDPLRQLASLLLDRHPAQLPDLSRHVVLFPHVSAVPRFRQMLLQLSTARGHTALLPPETTTLASWARRLSAQEKHVLSETARELLLFDLLLSDFPDLCRQCGVWPLIDSLLALFDELALNQCSLPDESKGFSQRVAKAYGIETETLAPFDNETQLVHSLWHQWRGHLAHRKLQDQTLALTDGLARSLKQAPSNAHIYLVGFVDFSGVEIEWIKTLRAQRRLTLVLHGPIADARLLPAIDTAPTSSALNSYTEFLNNVYASDQGNLMLRAQRQKAAVPESPARGRLTIHEAPDMEQEAKAIDLQVRRYVLQGCRDIGIVTHDRKLARRVRALLERANIGLQDAGGWALSTASAATALARWLECLENNFAHAPLLDLLKSPFLHLRLTRVELSRIVPVFEQAIVRRCNIAAGLDNYRFALERAATNLDQRHGTGTRESIAQLLDELEQAAQPLISLIHGAKSPARNVLDALLQSLERLGLTSEYSKDEAGNQLLDMLAEMRAALAPGQRRLDWAEIKQWLRRNIEQRRFHPPMRGRGVELMGFTESRLYRFDALIVAGALREHLPGQISAPPYFNDGVRAQLGLPGLERRYAALFHDFRRLLEAAPQVMISLHREHRGERLIPSPWVERLRAFHRLAYDEPLTDVELEQLLRRRDVTIVNREAPRPTPQKFPTAKLPASMVPSIFSASTHQRLLDCPYQFYCACGLSLAPQDEVREEMEKSDYGMQVHRILQAFHAGIPGLPGPWRTALDSATLPQAQMLLQQISHAVFAGDMRHSFLARGWLYLWQACIPRYLAWHMQRSEQWQVHAAELKVQRAYVEDGTQIVLSGRIDRLDRGGDGFSIIDYKTGAPPPKEWVASGENVQLPFYTLLLEENLTQALFLSLQHDGVSEKATIEGPALVTLRQNVKDRLLRLKRNLDAEAGLPAWGDTQSCERCEMEGLCRKEMWDVSQH